MWARRHPLALALSVLAFALPDTAHGAVTIGSSLASDADLGIGCNPAPTFIQTTLPGRVLASPVDGVITRWRLRYGNTFLAFEAPQLRVLRPTADGQWVGSGTSPFVAFPSATTPGGVVKETAVRLPVRAGDMLGLDAADGTDGSPVTMFVFAQEPEALLSALRPQIRDGEQRSASGGCFQNSPYELLMNADIELDADRDGLGDETQDDDPDGDGLPSSRDNCPAIANADQRDTDGDGSGNACEADADADNDGTPDARDNCPSLAAPNQADLDGDAQGDACDRDDDGDGVSDETEATMGSNPRSADSDGDGLGDLADRCPLQAGSVAGCPGAREAAPQIQGVPARMRRAAFLKGVRVRFSASTAMAADFELRAPVRATAIAAARRFELTLARGSLGSGTGVRSVVLRPSRRLVGRARRFRVALSVMATARDGSRLSLTRTIRVVP